MDETQSLRALLQNANLKLSFEIKAKKRIEDCNRKALEYIDLMKTQRRISGGEKTLLDMIEAHLKG